MQRVYGLDFDRVLDGTVSLHQAAALAACLPPGSLCLEFYSAELGWTREELLTLALVNSWRSKPIDPFGKRDGQVMDQTEYGDYLSLPREAAEQIEEVS